MRKKKKKKDRTARKCYHGDAAAAPKKKHVSELDDPDSRLSNQDEPAPATKVAKTVGEALFEMPRRSRERSLIVSDISWDDTDLVDSWFAEFGTTVSRALIQDAAARQSMTAEKVIGHDDRSRVESPHEAPYRWICSLIIVAANGSRWIGTGWLAGPRIVVTAGHNVFMHRQGGWANQIMVIPGRNLEAAPYGRVVARRFHSVAGWVNEKKEAHDYGAIMLPEPIGDSAGYFGYDDLSNTELNRSILNVIGYPGDKERGTMWGHSLGISRISSDTLTYDIDTAGGQSGAPVFRVVGDDVTVVGIHNYGDLAGNSASRINEKVFDNIVHWESS